jgi:hypothetical protein
MKKFLIRISTFALPLIIFPLLIFNIDQYIIKSYFQSNGDIIIFGDSHTETGINDDINNQLNNISQSSETYFLSYYKLKKILKKNKPSKIIISFSPHNLTFYQDEKMFGLNGSQRYKDLYPKYFLCLDREAIKQINKNSNIINFDIFNPVFKINTKSILKGSNAYIGEFRESLKSNLDTLIINKRVRAHYYNDRNNIYSISRLQIDYLKKINELCSMNNIDFYILNLPVYYVYKLQIPPVFVDSYNTVINELRDNGAQILDYSFINIPNNGFGDGDHLNTIGAKIITDKLIQDLDL